MKILHYSLGFPPYRSGGLTKFCVDLMAEQFKNGHSVALLWPGEMTFIGKRVCIKQRKNYFGIESFELINPLPVPFDEGLTDVSFFINEGCKDVYDRFLNEYKPEVIHIHTLMGLHKDFLVVAKNHGIRLVFTAHDFFPVCPKVTLFRNGCICKSYKTCEECGVCNRSALSLNKIKILQSPIYRYLKNVSAVRIIRKKHRDDFLGEKIRNDYDSVGTQSDFIKLRNHFQSILSLMDVIHYNSSVTKAVYESVFELNNFRVIPITHSDVSNHKTIKKYSDENLRIRYLGPLAEGKGFYILQNALDELWENNKKFCLDIHFQPIKASPYMVVHDRYKYEDLESIFDNTDVLVAPSIWYETFGYTVIEALSYGVPVVISSTVGAKDILVDGAGIVIEEISSKKLFQVLDSVDHNSLKLMNERILYYQNILTMAEMSHRVMNECYIDN